LHKETVVLRYLYELTGFVPARSAGSQYAVILGEWGVISCRVFFTPVG
jgi:hypothetical protein